jgi:hypothetical protein
MSNQDTTYSCSVLAMPKLYAERSRLWRERHPDRYAVVLANDREHKRKLYWERRAAWIASQGGKCVKCGGTDRLECDHIVRNGKVGHSIWHWSQARRDAELLKCQVLCHECHLTKTMAENKVDPSYRRKYEREIYVGA